jgi:hypothetical protein
VVLAAVAIALGGEPPKAGAPPVDVARYLANNREALLLSSAAWFVAAIFLLWFFGTLRAHLSAGEDTGGLAATSYGGGIFGAVFLTASFCGINAGVSQIAGADADPLAVRGFYDFSGAFFAMSGIGFAVFSWAAALAGARGRLLPRWLCWFGAAAGALQLLYAVNLTAAHGELANGGALGLLEPLFALVWFLSATSHFSSSANRAAITPKHVEPRAISGAKPMLTPPEGVQ